MTVRDPSDRTAAGPNPSARWEDPGVGSSPSPDPRLVSLIEVVRNHRPGDEREARSQSVMLAELERLDHPFDEDADLTHVTASAIVVGPRGVVLHRHRRLHRWMQPGGHVETGESPSDAALREVVEETGLPVAHPGDGPILAHVDVHAAARNHIHLDLRYLLVGQDVAPAPAPGESQDVAWFSWDAAINMADDALVGGLQSARRLIGTSAGRNEDPVSRRREDP